MWDAQSRTQRRVRLAAGGVVLAGGVLFAALQPPESSPGTVAAQLSDLAGGLVAPAARRIEIDAATVEASGLRRDRMDGTLVYRLMPGGEGSIVGRVVDDGGTLYVTLSAGDAAKCRGHSALRYLAPVSGLTDAVSLILGPGGLDAELESAGRELAPKILDTIGEPMRKRIGDRLKLLAAKLPDRQGPRLTAIANETFDELQPEIGALAEKLGDRALSDFKSIMAAAAGRAALNKADDAWAWVKSQFGGADDGSRRELLTDDEKKEIAAALKQELGTFWEVKRERILEVLGKVLDKHSPGFFKMVEEEWIPVVAEDARLVVAENAAKLNDMLSVYARDFAKRRIATAKGGPTLAVAYALRSGLDITNRPLLVIEMREPPAPPVKMGKDGKPLPPPPPVETIPLMAYLPTDVEIAGERAASLTEGAGK
jgi:hypothetical protein